MPNIRVGSAVLVERDGKILLGARGKEPGYGNIIIPGGGVNLYEDFRNTAHREIMEEAGVEITNLRQIGAFQIIDPEHEQHRVIIYWHADWASGEPTPSSDLLTAKFWSRAEIASGVAAGTINTITLDVLTATGWVL